MEVYPLTLSPSNTVRPDYAVWWEKLPGGWDSGRETYSQYIERTIKESLLGLRTRHYRTATEGTPLDVMTIKDIDLTDRRTFSLPMRADDAGMMTHIAVWSAAWDPPFALYRVTNVLTRTLTATSVTVEAELDVIGTVTMQTMPHTVGEVRGFWDVYHKNLGEPSKPYTQPMGVVKDLSVGLPRIPKWKYYSTLDPADLLFVKITGVKGGGFKTYGCLAFADPTVARAVLVSFDGTNSYYYPKIDDIVNDPQIYTPFDTADSILDISISARSPVPILTVEGGAPLDLSVDIITSDTLVLNGGFVALGTGTLRYGWTELSDASYGLSQSYDVPATGPISWSMWPLVEMDVRDMFGNVIANIDTRWCDGMGQDGVAYLKEYAEPTTVSGLKVTSSVTLTGIITSLVFPDGSHIDWPEGHLPYNTSVYKDYLATHQRYDREMLDIAIQQARGQTIINSSTSLVNGLLTGALSANPLIGIATTAVGVVGNIAEFEIHSETLRKELDAKRAQLQLMPDKTYVGSSDVEYIDGFKLKLEGKTVDMITVKLPTDSWYLDDMNELTWKWGYHQWFGDFGYYAGGRYAILKEDETFFDGVCKRVKMQRMTEIEMLRDRGDGWPGPFPLWMQTAIADRLMTGVDLRRMTR